jgi:hypothetical protein
MNADKNLRAQQRAFQSSIVRVEQSNLDHGPQHLFASIGVHLRFQTLVLIDQAVSR